MRSAWLVLAACGTSAPAVDAPAGGGDAPSSHGLSISPGTADFGSVPVGSQSAPKTFTISNGGTAAATSLSIAAIGPFALGASTCGASIAAGGSCTVDVKAAPTSVTTSSGMLRASDATSLTDAVLTMEPATADNIITVSPMVAAFGTVPVASTSTLTFTVTNIGGASQGPLQLQFIGVVGNQFNAISNNHCSGLTLGAGTSCMFDIHFVPTMTGAQTADLDVVGTNTVSIALNGTGT